MTTNAQRNAAPRTPQGKAAKWVDERLRIAGPLRTQLNKVFPDHWSFMLGEIALYSFIILLLTGTYLTFFFDPSMADTVYHGRYVPMQGVTMSRAYESTLNISFDVRGGPVIRQLRHCAALIGVHLALLVRQKHTEFPSAGRSEKTVSGERIFPTYAAKAGGFFFIVFGVTAALGGLAQINPVWLFGPYNPAQVSSGSQPDWYIGFLDGSTRLFPSWEIRLFHHTIPPLFWPTVVLPGILFTLAGAYPFLEAKLTKDRDRHNLL